MVCRTNVTRSLTVADMPPERLCMSYSQHCVPLVTIYWPDFSTHRHSHQRAALGRIFRYLLTPLPFDALNKENPLELSGSYLV